MKSVITLAISSLLLLTACSKFTDFTPPTSTAGNTTASHATEVFGVTFDPNHTWSTTTASEVTINANADVKKVQVLAFTNELDEDGDVCSNVSVLNEATLDGSTTVKLNYDAPDANEGIYVAFISENDYAIREIQNGVASLDASAKKASKRALPEGIELPTGDFTLAEAIPSYANQRNWVPGELLYDMSAASYERLKMTPIPYEPSILEDLKKMVLSYFVNKKENLPLVKASGMYNEKSYPITTGDDPIIVSPFYKQDGAPKWGCEVYNADLYYYYFKDEDLVGKDPVAYLQSLPKYKAIRFDQYYTDSEDDVLGRRFSYALLYWGKNPVIGETIGTFQFPKGYRIGFMVRSKATYTENGKGKDGEFYLDGRLNEHINSYGMIGAASKRLNDGEPRGAWLTIDNRLLMCFETGADTDFNDLLMEVEGGVEGIIALPDPVYNVYTYCFEDTEMGDYDMNDVVIKAVRKDATTVEYSVIACGAYDELYIKGINSGVVTDDKEVHSLFGKGTKTFINTVASEQKLSAVTVTKTVDPGFSLTDPNTQPYIYNNTTGLEVHVAKQGEDPHGIMIPNDFKYPLEYICIKDAYPQFNNWGLNPVLSTDWYTKPDNEKVYNK